MAQLSASKKEWPSYKSTDYNDDRFIDELKKAIALDGALIKFKFDERKGITRRDCGIILYAADWPAYKKKSFVSPQRKYFYVDSNLISQKLGEAFKRRFILDEIVRFLQVIELEEKKIYDMSIQCKEKLFGLISFENGTVGNEVFGSNLVVPVPALLKTQRNNPKFDPFLCDEVHELVEQEKIPFPYLIKDDKGHNDLLGGHLKLGEAREEDQNKGNGCKLGLIRETFEELDLEKCCTEIDHSDEWIRFGLKHAESGVYCVVLKFKWGPRTINVVHIEAHKVYSSSLENAFEKMTIGNSEDKKS